MHDIKVLPVDSWKIIGTRALGGPALSFWGGRPGSSGACNRQLLTAFKQK
jgi:hypothetical protein